MKTIKMSSARRSLAEYAAGLGDEIVVVTDRNLKAHAADDAQSAPSVDPQFELFCGPTATFQSCTGDPDCALYGEACSIGKGPRVRPDNGTP